MAEKVTSKPYPLFEAMCQANELPLPQREWKFHPTRKWAFDFAWPDGAGPGTEIVALEIEGGAFKGKGHRSVGKFLRDMEKYNEAAIAGWVVLRCTPDDVETGAVFELLKRALL